MADEFRTKKPPLKSVQLSYKAHLRRFFKRLKKQMLTQLEPSFAELELVRNDDIDTALDFFKAGIRSLMVGDYELLRVVALHSDKTKTANDVKYDKPIFRTIGLNDTDVDDITRRWIRTNVRLITNATERQLGAVENLMLQQFQAGVNLNETKKSLNKIFKGLRNNIDLIANDQVQKLSGFLDKRKQQSHGIESYEWGTVGDNAVRQKHAVRDGEIFDWNSPPPGGHPKTEINCRCDAEPELDSVLAAL